MKIAPSYHNPFFFAGPKAFFKILLTRRLLLCTRINNFIRTGSIAETYHALLFQNAIYPGTVVFL
jgi:hypothetical protein